MSTNLYEILGLEKSASPEDVRKAYKRKALATHPDRLPPNVSEAQKEQANEQFRLVNNAYEVLNNAENRKLYDQHGVWPPPAPEPQYSRPGPSFSQDPFASDPFFSRMNGSRRQYTFTDPFELFNSLFGDFHRAFTDDPFFADAFPSNRAGAARSPFGSMFGPSRGGPFDSFFRDPFGGSPFGPFGGQMMGGPMITDGGFGGQSRMYSSSTSSFGQNGRWVSQSQMSRTINGRTETIIKRRDAEGNEHVQTISPEGERYTINGVEQSVPGKSIQGPPAARPTITAPPAQAPPVRRSTYPDPLPQNPQMVPQPPVIPPKGWSSHEPHRDREAPAQASRASRDYAYDRERERAVHTSNEDAARRDRDGRHEYIDPARGYDSRGTHRRGSGSSRRHDYAESMPPQPQYAAAGAYGQQRAYDNAQPQASGRRAAPGTRAEPIYVDDNTPVVPDATRPSRSQSQHQSEEKRTRDGASPSMGAEHRKKWWHGPSAW